MLSLKGSLPTSQLDFAALVEELERAIRDKKHGRVVSPHEAHERIQDLYTWRNVAKRTEVVYNTVTQKPTRDLPDRLLRSTINTVSSFISNSHKGKILSIIIFFKKFCGQFGGDKIPAPPKDIDNWSN